MAKMSGRYIAVPLRELSMLKITYDSDDVDSLKYAAGLRL
jgi:hypothetical protein